MIGQDTEFFLWDTKLEKVVPSYKYFGKKEEEPQISLYVGDDKSLLPEGKRNFSFTGNSGNSARVYRDGLAVEVNSAPVTCRAWLWQDIRTALAMQLQAKGIPEHIRFTSRPWVAITPQLIRYFPADLRELGCMPSYDAYKNRRKVVSVDPMKTYYRTSGAHFHLSYFTGEVPKDFEEKIPGIIKLSDLLLGLPFTYIFGDELEFRRRKLYGQAGEYRPQHYPNDAQGVEYRVLSSRLYNHPGVFGLFAGLWKTMIRYNWERLLPYWDSAWEDDLQEAINLGTPKLFPKLLPLGQKLTQQAANTYEFGKSLQSPLGDGGVPMLWQQLREKNLKGEFPDAGVINDPYFPEAHFGWTEYATRWGLIR